MSPIHPPLEHGGSTAYHLHRHRFNGKPDLHGQLQHSDHHSRLRPHLHLRQRLSLLRRHHRPRRRRRPTMRHTLTRRHPRSPLLPPLHLPGPRQNGTPREGGPASTETAVASGTPSPGLPHATAGTASTYRDAGNVVSTRSPAESLSSADPSAPTARPTSITAKFSLEPLTTLGSEYSAETPRTGSSIADALPQVTRAQRIARPSLRRHSAERLR